jgi:hypothetical protein
MTDAPQPFAVAAPPPRKRSIIYIDGFNFYYGLLHERPDYKWLNYYRLAQLLRPDDDILQVSLFTALVDADLVPALKEVKRLSPHTRLVIYIPVAQEDLKHRREDEYRQFGHVQPIPEKLLRQAQFPARVEDSAGKPIERPKAWPPATS